MKHTRMKQPLTIYHGSPVIVEQPTFGKGRPENDYGLGFYCTESLELAKEWACPAPNQNGFANQYEIDLDGLRILRLNEGHSTLEWLTLLVENRTVDLRTPGAKRAAAWLRDHHSLNIKPYDAIIGYRADDCYFAFVRAFLNNSISLEQLELAMKLGDLGEQFVLKGERAFERVRFVMYHEALARIYAPKRSQRSQNAQVQYMRLLEEEDPEATYIRDLMNGKGTDSRADKPAKGDAAPASRKRNGKAGHDASL